jgi:mannose/fructose/N-acetylgalactosamine-specific phosphotransferase system component IIB
LPFILVANDGVEADDSATVEIASATTTAIVLIFRSLGFVVETYNHKIRGREIGGSKRHRSQVNSDRSP